MSLESRPSSWMIYGANGYTGALIAREAVRRGLRPVLAGRSEKNRALADELGLESRIFPLDQEPGEIAAQLVGIKLVLHCAGPFSSTSAPMLDACLQARAHYLDITGEVSVFEAIHARDDELKAVGITAMPGTGFDVVPTDCVAAILKRRMPDATELALGFRSSGSLSPGTAKSMIEGLAEGGKIRKDGKIMTVPLASKVREILFHKKPETAFRSPWGDVSTAFYSTGIPNIECYIATPARLKMPMRLAALMMSVPALRNLARMAIGKLVHGAGEEELRSGKTQVWGEVRNPRGQIETYRIEVAQGYRFTVISSLACVERALKGGVPPGALTPSMAFGPDFVLGLESVRELS